MMHFLVLLRPVNRSEAFGGVLGKRLTDNSEPPFFPFRAQSRQQEHCGIRRDELSPQPLDERFVAKPPQVLVEIAKRGT